jgi:Domain of unknown function (DUF4112)
MKPNPEKLQYSPQIGQVSRIEYPENPRLNRIRFFSRLLDSSIELPFGYRIGLDPIIGLIPGLGDVITTALSSYLIYESARLGLPKRVLLRMAGNVLVDGLAGEIPVAGDLFDAGWKSNMRNLRLVELSYHPTMPERPASRILMVVGGGFLLLGTVLISLQILLIRFVLSTLGLW